MVGEILPENASGVPKSGRVADELIAVRIRGVVKTFGVGARQVIALRGVDWDVWAGQISMLVGPSGCGKTTLLSILAGILNADAGSVEIFGRNVSEMDDGSRTQFRAGCIGFVFQQYNLLPALSAVENAALPLIIAGQSWTRAALKAKELLGAVGLAERFESTPSQLSGGEQQRVAIARALIHDPRLVVADEPTAAIDYETGQSVMHLLRQVAVRPDRAVIVVTHDNRIFHFADRVTRMDDGRIVSNHESVRLPVGSGPGSGDGNGEDDSSGATAETSEGAVL